MSEERDGFEIQQTPESEGQPLSQMNPQQDGGVLNLLRNLNVDAVDKTDIKAGLVGIGGAAAVKYLSDDIPPVLKAMMGAGLAAFAGERLIGPTGRRSRRKKR